MMERTSAARKLLTAIHAYLESCKDVDDELMYVDCPEDHPLRQAARELEALYPGGTQPHPARGFWRKARETICHFERYPIDRERHRRWCEMLDHLFDNLDALEDWLARTYGPFPPLGIEEQREQSAGLQPGGEPPPRSEIERPRNMARDTEIARLRDDGVPWSQVPKRLKQINPAWSRPGGQPLKVTALRQAYSRFKARHGSRP